MQVRIESGPIEGALTAGTDGHGGAIRVALFKGVPFAAAPVGDLRWRPPQPVESWSEVRPCLSFGRACSQPRSIAFDTPMRTSEDCLYLNVWTPADFQGARLPVMVWIHGGGHVTGTGASLAYDGQNFARRGIVLVTINYRLGPLGYFAHPLLSAESEHGASGNYGELDILAALNWVQRNIAAFGGDPGCVTIFGESAGAVSIGLLMTSPLARGLFHRAICQSGGPCGKRRRLKESVGSMESAEEQGERIARLLNHGGKSDPLSELRATPADDLIKATNPAQGLFATGEKFGPIIDGHVFPKDPDRCFRDGQQAAVPLLTGANADEGTIFLHRSVELTLPNYRRMLQKLFGDVDAALSLFPCANDADVAAAMNRVITVAIFSGPARFTVDSMRRIDQPGYCYHFARVPNTERAKRDGCFHALEILYVFGSNARLRGFDDSDRQLSSMMTDYWSNFARSGNPNAPHLPSWPTWTPGQREQLRLDIEPSIQPSQIDAAYELLIAHSGS